MEFVLNYSTTNGTSYFQTSGIITFVLLIVNRKHDFSRASSKYSGHFLCFKISTQLS